MYPDELPDVGTVELVSEEPVAEEEVPHDDAKWGDFIKVQNSQEEYWFAAPRDLLRALGEAKAEPGHVFQVRSAERGDKAHDPWKFEVAHDPEHH